MGFSTGRDLHIDQLTSKVVMGYRPQGHIADLILPMVTVPKQSDLYPIFSRAEMLALQDDERAPGVEANLVTRSVSSGSYYCIGRALKDSITIEDKNNMDPIYIQSLYNNRGKYLAGKLMANWDNRVSLQVNSGSNVGSYSAVGSSWSDATNSDPFGDVNTMLDNVQDSTGYRPNRIVLGLTAWRLLRRHNNIINKVFQTGIAGGAPLPSRRQIADLFEVEEVIVGESFKNTANEAQSESLSKIWDNNVLAYYVPRVVTTLDEPSFGYSIRWVAPGLPNWIVERHPYDTRRKCEEIEVGYHQTEKITGPEYGFLLQAVNSST